MSIEHMTWKDHIEVSHPKFLTAPGLLPV